MIDESKLITVASGKGGVGKTWLSVSLCHALARSGHQTLLFDGDLGLANVDIQLGLMPRMDVGDVINGSARVLDAITRYDEGKGDGGFDVLAGKSGSGALGNLSKERLAALRQGLIDATAQYDAIVLDLAAGIDPSVTILSNHRGVVLVVMNADPTSLTDAYAFIKVTRMRNPDADIRIVVNNVASRREGEKCYEAIRRACEGFLKMTPKLAGIIKSDKRVVDAIRNQTPLLTRHPQSEAGAAVQELARGLNLRAPAL